MTVAQPIVHLLIDGVWTEITEFVYTRDGVELTEGTTRFGYPVDPSTLVLTLDNRDGRFSPRNPMSPYLGHLQRNTPIRLRAEPLLGLPRFVFFGFVSEWPLDWTPDGKDVFIQIEASSLRRRLSQARGISAVLNRWVKRVASQSDDIIGYWPCDDGEGSTVITSAIGGRNGRFSTTDLPDFADYGSFDLAGSLPIMRMGGSGANFSIPNYFHSGQQYVVFVFHADPDAPDGHTLCVVETQGTLARTQIAINTLGFIRREFFNDSGTSISVATGSVDVRGRDWLAVLNIGVGGFGAEFHGEFYALDRSAFLVYDTVTDLIGETVGRVGQVGFAQDDYPMGHLIVARNLDDFATLDTAGVMLATAATGWRGEPAATRVSRLCDEEDLDFLFLTNGGHTADDTARLGPQFPDTLINIIDEAVFADMAILLEKPDEGGFNHGGFVYESRASMYEATPTLHLDYALGEIALTPSPVDDDENLVNDVTVKRTEGSSARRFLQVGSLSTAPPPAGVGPYDDEVEVNVHNDLYLPDQASFRLHIGTLDEPRYPVIAVELASEAFIDEASFQDDAFVANVGERIVIDNMPSGWLPPDQVDLLIIGRTISWTDSTCLIQFSCVPAAFVRGAPIQDEATMPSDTLVRYAAFDSINAIALNSTVTEFSVTSESGTNWITTVDYPDHFPFDINVGGERMTVTGIERVLNVHVFTVTRSTNGVVKAQTAGTAVQIWQPQRSMLDYRG